MLVDYRRFVTESIANTYPVRGFVNYYNSIFRKPKSKSEGEKSNVVKRRIDGFSCSLQMFTRQSQRDMWVEVEVPLVLGGFETVLYFAHALNAPQFKKEGGLVFWPNLDMLTPRLFAGPATFKPLFRDHKVKYAYPCFEIFISPLTAKAVWALKPEPIELEFITGGVKEKVQVHLSPHEILSKIGKNFYYGSHAEHAVEYSVHNKCFVNQESPMSLLLLLLYSLGGVKSPYTDEKMNDLTFASELTEAEAAELLSKNFNGVRGIGTTYKNSRASKISKIL